MFSKEKREKRKERRRKMQEDYIKSVYQNWGPISEKGKTRYMLVKATYGWALQVFLIYIVLMYIMSKFNKNFIFDWITVLFAAVIFFIFGLIQGAGEFNRNEKIYREKYPYSYKPKKKNKNK